MKFRARKSIRRTAAQKLDFPFPWFHDAGVFVLSQLPAIILFLVGWGPIYSGLADPLKVEYALVDGVLRLAGLVCLLLSGFFLFLDSKMKEHVKRDAGDEE